MLRIAVVISLVCSLLAIGSAIVANQSSTIAQQLAHGDFMYRLEVAAVILPIWGIACWPWLLAYRKANADDRTISTLVFAAASAGLAAYCYTGIATAPSEGTGLFVIIYYLVVWALYPITLVLRRN